MKRLLIIAAVTFLSTASIAQAHPKGGHHRGDKHDGYDYARVIDVKPIFNKKRHKKHRRDCRVENTRHTYYNNRSHAEGLIVGGLIGGVIGNSLGEGRDAAVVAGTLLGSAIGHNMDKHNDGYNRGRTTYREHCDSRHDYRPQIDGYRVTYRYKGEISHTRLDYRPGKRIRIRVDNETRHRRHGH